MNLIKFFPLAVIFLVSSFSFSQTKVYVALITTVSDEPHLAESFIAGYESNGGKWTGSVKIDTGISEEKMYTHAMPFCYNNGYDLVLRNTGPSYYLSMELDSFYNQGIQIVSGTGSNRFRRMSAGSSPLPQSILCGAGDTINQTGYYCEFFDVHPFGNFPIISLEQIAGDTLIVETDIKTNGGYVIPSGFMVNISGISGYENNPAGSKIVTAFVEDNAYNKFKIIHNLGKGRFKTGGFAKMYTQSYSHAYIAGKLAYIKDQLNCTWWEARYRMRMTASNKGSYDTYDGYGKPDVASALTYTGEIIEDPFNKLGTMGDLFEVKRSGNTVKIKFEKVINALKYYFYDNYKLIGTVPVAQGFSKYNVAEFNISPSDPSPHKIWYVAFRGEQMSGASKQISIE